MKRAGLADPEAAPIRRVLMTTDLSELLDRPGVMDRVTDSGVRFIVWLDGSTDRVASGGSTMCAAPWVASIVPWLPLPLPP